MTFLEFHWLAQAYRHRQEREDRRAAMGAWVLANVHRDSKQRPEPFSLEEVTSWLGYARQYVSTEHRQAAQAPARPTIDALKRKIDAVHMLHQGLYGTNGQAQDGEAGASRT